MDATQCSSEDSRLFPHLKLASFLPLSEIKEREKCTGCGRKRMYFCYDCRVYVGNVGALVPGVKLPLKVDILKHQRELNGKSTAVHAALLDPDNVRIFDKFNQVPDYKDCPGTVVLFPSARSTSIQQFVVSEGPVRRLIVLDSTWNGTGSLKALPQLAQLPWVHLSNYRTEYWRPQNGLSAEYLATIEAIYYACRECVEAERNWRGGRGELEMEEEEGGEEKERLDGLLFWFYFFRSKVPTSKFGQKPQPAGKPSPSSLPPPAPALKSVSPNCT